MVFFSRSKNIFFVCTKLICLFNGMAQCVLCDQINFAAIKILLEFLNAKKGKICLK